MVRSEYHLRSRIHNIGWLIGYRQRVVDIQKVLIIFLKKVIHPGHKHSNTIKYKMREMKVPQRYPLGLGLWEYFRGEIL